MADSTIVQLTEDTAPASTDMMETVKDPSGTPLSRKVTIARVRGTVGKFVINARSWVASATNGCGGGSLELATNKQNIAYLAFDPTTVEYAEAGLFEMPSDWDGGTITATIQWFHNATTVNFGVVFGLQGRSYADDEALDQAWGTAQEVTDTGGTTTDHYKTPVTAAITLAGTPAAGESIQLRLYRLATSGSDTLAVDANVTSVTVFYTRQ